MRDEGLSKVEGMIYLIRGQKVMLDSDLATLYEIETSQLNRQVSNKTFAREGDSLCGRD